jgi:hypothetical protein
VLRRGEAWQRSRHIGEYCRRICSPDDATTRVESGRDAADFVGRREPVNNGRSVYAIRRVDVQPIGHSVSL